MALVDRIAALERRLGIQETIEGGSSGGATTFTDLTDTPSSYSGQSGRSLRVNGGETALQFFTPLSTSTTPSAGQLAIWTGSTQLQGLPADYYPVRSGTPTNGNVTSWNGSTAVQDAGFSASSVVRTTQSNVVTTAMIQQVATQTLLGRNTAGTGNVEVLSALPASIEAAIDHGTIAGLGDDDHTQYALLAGRSGGQTVTGGTAASQSLKLRGTSHATPGDVRVLDRLRVGADSAPAAAVDATAPDVNTPAVVARGVASQVAPVVEVENSSGDALFGVSEARGSRFGEHYQILTLALPSLNSGQTLTITLANQSPSDNSNNYYSVDARINLRAGGTQTRRASYVAIIGLQMGQNSGNTATVQQVDVLHSQQTSVTIGSWTAAASGMTVGITATNTMNSNTVTFLISGNQPNFAVSAAVA